MFGESEDERGAGISRRAFLAGACVTGAAAMVGGLNACAPPQDAGPGGAGGTGSGANGGAVPVSKAPSKVDKTYDADLLIVGAGGSGLAGAVQAALNGTNLILVDKSNQVVAMRTSSRACSPSIPRCSWSKASTCSPPI